MQKFARQPALILNLWPVYRPRLAPLGVGGWGGCWAVQGLSRPPLALPVASTRGQGADISQKALPGFVGTADLGPGLEQAGSHSQAGGFRVWNVCVAGDGAESSSSPLPGRVSLRLSRGPAADKEPG